MAQCGVHRDIKKLNFKFKSANHHFNDSSLVRVSIYG